MNVARKMRHVGAAARKQRAKDAIYRAGIIPTGMTFDEWRAEVIRRATATGASQASPTSET